jgi:hypothetical protein
MFLNTQFDGPAGWKAWDNYINAARRVEGFGDTGTITDPKQVRRSISALKQRRFAFSSLKHWVIFMEDPEIEQAVPNAVKH